MSMKMFDIILMIGVIGTLAFSFMTYQRVSGSGSESETEDE